MFSVLVNGILGNCIASIHPVRIYVNGSRKVSRIPSQRSSTENDSTSLTVNASLESLSTHFARQIPYAQFLVEFDHNGVFVVAEQACKRRREGFSLFLLAENGAMKGAPIDHLFWSLWLSA